MEFIKQLVAFGLLCGAGNRILLKNKGDIEDAWTHCTHTTNEADLLEPMSEENRQFYQEWINKEQAPPPAVEEES